MMGSQSPAAVRTHGLTKWFGSTLALDRLDLEIRPGEVFGFLGPNGAGKSTTVRLLLGLIRPSAGRASIFDVDASDAVEAHHHVAYVPADVALWPNLTGAEALALLANLGRGTDRAYQAQLISRFDLQVDRRCGTYSTGNRQKVALIAAFATRAPLLVLDEPTSGLDPLMEQEFRSCLREAAARGQTAFLSSHHLAEVEAVCDRVGILRAGQLVEVAELEDLRRLRVTELTATFTGQAPRSSELVDLPGVSAVRPVSSTSLALTLTGSPGPALSRLATGDLASLQLREPSLEEIFLEYYGKGTS
jgi:ABC-2 type transport system ATP-binding protein